MPGAPKALEDLKQALMNIPTNEVEPFRNSAVEAVNNAMRVARSFKEDMAKYQATFTQDGFNPKTYSDLELRGMAFWQAEVNLRQVLDPEDRMAKLVPEGTASKKMLLAAAEYLWDSDPDLGPKVAAIRTGTGYLDLADDLLALSTLLMDRWHEIEGKSRITKSNLGKARELGQEIVKTLTPKNDTKVISDARDMRNRAGYHLACAVSAVRAAAMFIYYKTPEAMDRYPALYSRQRRTKKAQATAGAPAPVSTTGDEM